VHVLGTVTGASEMFRHDGPLSVLRGFTRTELEQLAAEARLSEARVHWRWAFRWVLTTISARSPAATDSAKRTAA